MPVHNQLVRGWLTDALKRALGVTKDPGGIERYGETLVPTFDPWDQPEWAYLRGEKLAAQSRFQAAAPGEFGMIALLNPSNIVNGIEQNRTIAVVDAISAFSTGAIVHYQVALQTQAALVATLTFPGGIGSSRDRRWTGPSGAAGGLNTICQTLAGSDAAAFGNVIDTQGGASVPAFQSVPIVLQAGQGVVVQGATVNIAMFASFNWRERIAFPGELL